MWIVTNKTPFASSGAWVQDKNANKVWLVIIKATFEIRRDGSVSLSDQQIPVFLMPQPAGRVGKSLIYESDLLGVKPCTDVLVNGNAWVPNGRSARSVDIQFAAGPINKRLRVFGDRVWENSLTGVQISPAQKFESMPITYENAYGGYDSFSPDPTKHRIEERNPVGTGFVTGQEKCVGVRLPNIEYPNQLISSWKHRPQPAGLSVIDSSWSPRRELAGTYDEQWIENRFPLWAEDFDPRYRNCAPFDQQACNFFRGGEIFDLYNLSREGRLRFKLPQISLSIQTRFGRDHVEHRAQLSTVIVEPEFPRVILSWQTSLVCNHRVDELDETIVSKSR